MDSLVGSILFILVTAIVVGWIQISIENESRNSRRDTKSQSNHSNGSSSSRYTPDPVAEFCRKADPALDRFIADYIALKNCYTQPPAKEKEIRAMADKCLLRWYDYWAASIDRTPPVYMPEYMRTYLGSNYDPCMRERATLEAQLNSYCCLAVLGNEKVTAICNAIMDRLTEKGSIMRCRLGASGIGGASKEQLTACHSLLMRQRKVSEYKYNNRYYITFPGWDHDRVLAYVQDRASKEASAPPAAAPAQFPPLQLDKTGLGEDILRFLDFGGDIPRQELLSVPFPSYTSAQVTACYDALLQSGLVREYPKGKTVYSSVVLYNSDGSPASSHQSNPATAEAPPAHTPSNPA